MNHFFPALDRTLSIVLMILVVFMVCSITSEIVLNAIIQPAVSFMLAGYESPSSPDDNPLQSAFSLVSVLESLMHFVANASAPVNTASQTILVWIGILGSALAFRQRAHLGVDALVRVYPPNIRWMLEYVSTACVALFSLAVFVVGGIIVCQKAFAAGSKMPGFEHFNRGWFYLVLVITGLLNLVYCIYHLMHPRPVGIDTKEHTS